MSCGSNESGTHRKHIASALQRLIGLCSLGQISAFIDENHSKHTNTGRGKIHFLNVTEVGSQPVVSIVFQVLMFRSLRQYLLNDCEL
jgi:hypothetical protein